METNVYIVLRVKSFQSYTVEHTTPPTIPDIQAMIEDYLGRDDEELAKLKAERRPGRPASTRETLLRQHQHMENLKKLKEWGGQWSGLATIRPVRITRDGVKKESSFPPKGMS
jgi:translation machinery-associated protein 16